MISPLASEGETKIKEKRKGECGHNAPRRWKAPSLPERPLLCGERRRGRSPAQRPSQLLLRCEPARMPTSPDGRIPGEPARGPAARPGRTGGRISAPGERSTGGLPRAEPEPERTPGEASLGAAPHRNPTGCSTTRSPGHAGVCERGPAWGEGVWTIDIILN